MINLFFWLFLAAPVIVIIGITFLVEKLLKKKKLNPLFSLLASFAVTYVLVSSVLLVLDYQEAPSEKFGIPWFGAIGMLSAPTGMLADQLFRARVIGAHVRDGLIVLAGLIQWEIILFVIQKLRLRKR
jgi:hypothetical protein